MKFGAQEHAFRLPARSERESPVRGRAIGRHGGIDADNDEQPVLTGDGELCKYWSATCAGLLGGASNA